MTMGAFLQRQDTEVVICEKLSGIRKLGLSDSLKPSFLKTTAEFFADEDTSEDI